MQNPDVPELLYPPDVHAIPMVLPHESALTTVPANPAPLAPAPRNKLTVVCAETELL